mmetsp:Transcript_6388/g.15497  ORF Transcript_6388/g.15497 Transcript_6388/m.15497 type:complete len:352 (+) Transcript_6388:485-1540(+)
MQDSIGGSTGNHNNSNGILKSSLRHDIAGFEVQSQKLLHGFSGSSALPHLFLGIGRGRTRVGEGHTEGLDGSGHGVGRVHTTAGTLAGTRVLDDFHSLFLGNLVVKMLSVRLEGTDNIEGFSGGGLVSSTDGSAIDHDRWSIQSCHSHNAPGHVLVTTRQGNQTVIPLGSHGRFDGISDQITRLKGVSHSGSSHRNTVGNTNSVESHSDAVAGDDTLLDVFRKLQKVHVTWVSLIPNRTNSDLWLVHVFLGHTGGVKHGLRISLDRGLCQDATPSVQDNLIFVVTFGEQRGGRQFLNSSRWNSECQSIRCEQGDGCSRDLHCCRDLIPCCISRQIESFCSPLFGIFRNAIR